MYKYEYMLQVLKISTVIIFKIIQYLMVERESSAPEKMCDQYRKFIANSFNPNLKKIIFKFKYNHKYYN